MDTHLIEKPNKHYKHNDIMKSRATSISREICV